ncbi:MAG: bi-domain-containing oxidoreductase [Gemmatimonadales bacterium]
MRQVLQHLRSGSLEVVEVPVPACRPGGVLVRTSASLISAGTERVLLEFAGKSLLGKARERPDLVRQVLEKVKRDGLVSTIQTVLSRLDQPLPLGYSCAGVVVEVGRGTEEFAPGDRVACAGMGYASHAEVVFVPRNLAVAVPPEVSSEDAAWVTLGAIALQGVRIAEPRLGENVAVVGLGLLGQLAAQILRASGCRVLGIDLDPAKAALAVSLGADQAVARSEDPVGRAEAFSGGVGMDAVLVTAATESNDPIELAGQLCRDRGRVVVVGAVGMEVPRKPYYEKELELRLSRSYGPGRYDPDYEEEGRDYPIGYVRWTERRNMAEFLRLVAARQVEPSRLTTHRFPIQAAEQAYALLSGDAPSPPGGVLLTYGAGEPPGRSVTLSHARVRSGTVGLGFIGAGNFARAVLLPRFARRREAAFVGIATATGLSARTAGAKFGFRYCTSDPARLLQDPDIEAVVIVTRHGSHARLAAEALRAGKAVFLEKPLAIDEAGLEEVISAQRESGGLLTVGFNRRFSGLIRELEQVFPAETPLALSYRINAGPVPLQSWLHDPVEGGGRIIGEVCHFVDVAQFLTGESPCEVFAFRAESSTPDTLTAVLRFDGGSVANIGYFATGDRTFPKERIEVFGGGAVGVVDDFRSLKISRNGRRSGRRRLTQDKGYDQEIQAFLQALRTGGAPPLPIASLVATTRTTFAIVESLSTGRPVRIALG